jgi:hypothetical protein
VHSLYGSGFFLHDLQEHFADNDDLVISEIIKREQIYDTIKDFLGKGR